MARKINLSPLIVHGIFMGSKAFDDVGFLCTLSAFKVGYFMRTSEI